MRAHGRHDVVTIPTIRIAFVLSILVHAALLWLVWPHLRSLTQAYQQRSTSLAVDLAPRNDRIASARTPVAPSPAPSTASPPPAPPASVAVRPPPPVKVPPPRRRPPQPKPSERHAPTVLTQPPRPPATASVAPPQPAPTPSPPAPAPPVALEPLPAPSPPAAAAPSTASPPAQDLASYVAAQRRARGESTDSSAGANTSGESDVARRDRIVAANLGLDKTPSFGTDVRNAGGLFQITEIGYDDARFWFFGFDNAIRRNARQLIEVRKGSAPDIRIAVVRKMIAIIRENINGDFVWVSQRLGHGVTLSSRPGDDAALEAFILRDIFPEVRQP